MSVLSLDVPLLNLASDLIWRPSFQQCRWIFTYFSLSKVFKKVWKDLSLIRPLGYKPYSRFAFLEFSLLCSLRKQPIFGDATTSFPAKWRLRNKQRNSIQMTRHYSDLGCASDWLNQISHARRPIRSTTQIWLVTRHHYGISAIVSQTSFGGETSGSVAKCRLFSQATYYVVLKLD